MNSSIPQKHSITISGHRTSLSLEKEFWDELKTIAAEGNLSLANLIEQVDAGRNSANLSSALRVFVLRNLKKNTES